MRVKILIGGLLVGLTIVLLGCSSVSPLPSSLPDAIPTSKLPVVPIGEKPPDNVNWISPAKVNISNFHLGATAEYPITVHNGNKTKTQFVVAVRIADYTSAGYIKLPTDIMQDWVIVADSTPILASLETKDILITLTMPNEISDAQAQLWQATDEASTYYVALQTAAVKAVTDVATQTINNRYKSRPQDILPEMITELITPEAIHAELIKNPDAILLEYMIQNSSVSFRKFQADQGKSIAIATSLEQRGYLQKGDLRKGKWEFWVSVRQAPQPGITGTQMETETCSRWQVVMRT